MAVDRDLTRESVLGTERTFLREYTAEHIGAVGEDDRPWPVTLGTGSVHAIDGTPHLVFPLEIRPPDGQVTDFDLRYDVIVEELLTHRIIATVRYDFDRGILKTDDAQTLEIFDYTTKSLEVPAGEGSWLRGFATTAGLGVEHVGEGADHLLFLLMLLISAPLVATGGRWRTAPSARRAVGRVVHVVTAFAIGHSLTLAPTAAGVIDLPTRPVETLIGLSIAVSAVHAVRPLVAGGEVFIAGGLGLVHGLAFASLIGDLGLDRGSLVTTLLGFNLGIVPYRCGRRRAGVLGLLDARTRHADVARPLRGHPDVAGRAPAAGRRGGRGPACRPSGLRRWARDAPGSLKGVPASCPVTMAPASSRFGHGLRQGDLLGHLVERSSRNAKAPSAEHGKGAVHLSAGPPLLAPRWSANEDATGTRSGCPSSNENHPAVGRWAFADCPQWRAT